MPTANFELGKPVGELGELKVFWLHRFVRYGWTGTDDETGRMDHEMRYWWTWRSALAVPYSAGSVSSAVLPCFGTLSFRIT